LPLDEDVSKREVQLLGIRGKAAFVWGDGNSHQDSYYFTKNSGVKLKINVDAHRDDLDETDFPIESSHMFFTKQDGIETIVMGNSEPLKLIDFKEKALSFDQDEIALTIDTDAILNFPVFLDYAIGTLSPLEIIEFVKMLGQRVSRLDLGGLVNSIPDFELLKDIDLGSQLSRDEQSEFAFYDGIGLESLKDIYNKVGSYVAHTYARILEAFVACLK
jgi:hypothetical protein